jgi:hypothetical protein
VSALRDDAEAAGSCACSETATGKLPSCDTEAPVVPADHVIVAVSSVSNMTFLQIMLLLYFIIFT